MRCYKLVCVVALVASCGGGSSGPADAGVDGGPDALVITPDLTSFVANPALVQPGVPTIVTWTWSYGGQVTTVQPSCSIDMGVGPVMVGQATSITITNVTTYTLSCVNSAGTGTRQVVVTVPPVAPSIATFTATPTALTPNVSSNVTWNWTYTTPPIPAATCAIEHGVGSVTPGSSTPVTLSAARTFRLRCSNSMGSNTRDVTLTVDECAANIDDCGANATCVDTPESFTCQCNAGYTGNGDTCSQLAACDANASLCDANATCTNTANGFACVCNAGHVGNGATCQRSRVAFVTSTTGTGNLSTWADAGGMTGVAAGDAICNARATAAGLPGTYVAWISSSTSDAYCRLHGLTGKKSAMCGQGALPVAAGPWVRRDNLPFAPTIDRLLAPTRALYHPASLNESASQVTTSLNVYTGTDDQGVGTGATCIDWTSTASVGTTGEAAGGGVSWTRSATTDLSCSGFARLRCLQTTLGPALPSRHPIAKRAFLTSVQGTGVMSTWSDVAGTGLSGVAAGDAVCQARARYAGYANPQNFRAWLSTSSASVSSRIFTNGPWARPDGIIVASSRTDLFSFGRLLAPLHLTETGAYIAGDTVNGATWTGTSSTGSSTGSHCSSWTSTFSSGTSGRHDLVDFRWTNSSTASCSTAMQRIACFED